LSTRNSRLGGKTRLTPTVHRGGIVGLLRPYWIWIGLLVALTIAANSFNLVIPQIVASAIDGIGKPDLSLTQLAIEFLAVAAGIFVLTYLQSIRNYPPPCQRGKSLNP
jgi:ABC-type multidrug transport system fused ATPase/permease subunit